MVDAVISLLVYTPWWVFVIFGYLLFVGLKATKPRTVPLVQLFLLPSALTIWSLINFFRNTSVIFPALLWWLIILAGGLTIGFFIYSKRNIIINDQTKMVHLHGSWLPFILIMSIFIVKYYFGYSCAMSSSINECSMYRLYSSYFSAFASGILMGNIVRVVYIFIMKK